MPSSRLITCLTAASLTAVTTVARAQVSSVNVTTTGITEQLTNGGYYPTHIVDGSYKGIGFADCQNDAEFVFPLTIAGLPDTTVTFEIWAGTGDCTQMGATNNASTGICWPVAPNPTPQNVLSVPIRVQDIVSGLGKSPPQQSYSSAASDVCTSAAQSTTTTVTDDSGTTSTTSGEATVSIFFMFFPTGSSTPSVTATPYPIKVKLSGPGACANLTAGPGDGLLVLNWDPPTGETDIQGYDLIAQPIGTTAGDAASTQQVCPDVSQPGTELTDDAGNPILDDAGNPIFVDDAGNPVPLVDAGCFTEYVPPPVASCTNGSIDTTTAALVCGGDAGANPTLQCTQVNGTTNSSGLLTNLTNGVNYAVGVAAFDQYGNVGSISNIACSMPQPINDFWKIYNQEGGTGFCALDVVGAHGAPVFALGLGFVGIALLRRRQKTRA